jgi:SAM-dependent methyltransferase
MAIAGFVPKDGLMLKSLVQKALYRCGYRISRIPRPEAGAAPQYPVDPEELAELMRDLERFAGTKPGHGSWSDPSGARQYLHDKRLCFYHNLLDVCARHGVRFEPRCDVADIGSGPGYLLRLLSRLQPGCTLTGYDTYADLTELAKTLCPSARFVPKDLFNIEDEQYDVVFNTEVLEHLIRPDLALQHMLTLLRPGGALVLTVPDGRLDTFGAGRRLDNGRGYWGHINFWSPESWEVFVTLNAGNAETALGTVATGENYAILRRRP